MCRNCGCGQGSEHSHSHDHGHEHGKIILLEKDVLAQNDRHAQENRRWFNDNGICAINVISAPGSGKTALLERTAQELNAKIKISLIVGDQQTDNDAERLRKFSPRVKQINTHDSCHLDARMISRELGSFVSQDDDLLIIENVGNLVCPAAIDLGEHRKIAVLSVTEGEDKPVKYPTLFHDADLVVISKIDLLPYLDWSMTECERFIRRVNPRVNIVALSSKSGEGLEKWFGYLTSLS
jgi:hydrogenase nickel incorporation protein HypB